MAIESAGHESIGSVNAMDDSERLECGQCAVNAYGINGDSGFVGKVFETVCREWNFSLCEALYDPFAGFGHTESGFLQFLSCDGQKALFTRICHFYTQN